MNWKTIFNPFEKFEEKILLVIGIVSFFGLLAICFWTNSFFSSIYRINHLEKTTFQNVALHTLISFLVAIIFYFILGKFFYKKTRLIDIVNTVLISQIPLIIILPSEKINYIKTSGDRMLTYQGNHFGSFPILDFIIMILVIVMSVAALIYSFVLLFNGFKTATNIKTWQKITVFCAVTFLLLIICQIFNQ